MGITPAGETASLSGASLAGHATVTGPTGTGKTTTLLRLAYGVLVDWEPLRLPLVMFDFKADPRVAEALAGMAARTGRRFHLVSVTDQTEPYNPIREGSAEEVAARLIETMSNAEDGGFSEPHHRTVGERWLIMAAKVLDDLIEQGATHRRNGVSEPWRRTVEDLAAVMRPDEIAAHLPSLSAPVCRRAKGLLDELKAEKDLQRSILGMRSRVALMAETSAGTVMTDSPDGLVLAHAIEAGDVVLFSLSAAANPAASRVVGNMAIGDLGAQFDALLRRKWAERTGRRVVVMLDEFSGLGGSALQSLFERARGGGGALITSTQVDANYTDVSDSFGESVWGNSNVWLLHRQPGESAEKRAEGIGTAPAWMETVQVTEDADPLGSTTGGTGVGTLRKVERFRVHPNELKELGTGQVILRCASPRTLERVLVAPIPELAGRPGKAARGRSEPASRPRMAARGGPARAEAAPATVERAPSPAAWPRPDQAAPRSRSEDAEQRPVRTAGASTGEPWGLDHPNEPPDDWAE